MVDNHHTKDAKCTVVLTTLDAYALIRSVHARIDTIDQEVIRLLDVVSNDQGPCTDEIGRIIALDGEKYLLERALNKLYECLRQMKPG